MLQLSLVFVYLA